MLVVSIKYILIKEGGGERGSAREKVAEQKRETTYNRGIL